MNSSRKKFSSQDILTELRRNIISEKYLPHEKLPPERVLAGQFGVARGTLREALKKLEQLNLVTRRAGFGTFVNPNCENESSLLLTSMRPLELIEARFAIEPQIVRLAVLHANQSNLENLERTLIVLERTITDPASFAENDERFHLQLAEVTQNSLLIWMMRHANKVRSHTSWIKMRTLTLSPEMIIKYNKQHRDIFEAIKNRDADSASKLMRAHLAEARQSMINVTS